MDDPKLSTWAKINKIAGCKLNKKPRKVNSSPVIALPEIKCPVCGWNGIRTEVGTQRMYCGCGHDLYC